MKLVTWNVNSIRTRLQRALALLERHRPDVVCLQETKVVDEAFPADAFEERGYHVACHGQKTYNGVALLSREPLEDVRVGFDGDPIPEQARVIAATCAGVRVINAYVVNGKTVDSDAYQLKLRWLDALTRAIAAAHAPHEPLVMAGDFNVAPDDRDVHDPHRWRGRVLFSEPEHQRLRTLLDWGLRDLLREHTDEGGIYSWWDYRHGAFGRGWGLRIDLILGTAPVARAVRSVRVDRDERKKGADGSRPSDHAPVIAEFEPG